MLEATKEVIAAIREFDNEVSRETSPVLFATEKPGVVYPPVTYVMDKNRDLTIPEISKHCDLSLVAENDFFFVWSHAIEEHSQKTNQWEHVGLAFWILVIQPIWAKTLYSYAQEKGGDDKGMRPLLSENDFVAVLASQGVEVSSNQILEVQAKHVARHWKLCESEYIRSAKGNIDTAHYLCRTACEHYMMTDLAVTLNDKSKAIGFMKECKEILFAKES